MELRPGGVLEKRRRDGLFQITHSNRGKGLCRLYGGIHKTVHPPYAHGHTEDDSDAYSSRSPAEDDPVYPLQTAGPREAGAFEPQERQTPRRGPVTRQQFSRRDRRPRLKPAIFLSGAHKKRSFLSGQTLMPPQMVICQASLNDCPLTEWYSITGPALNSTPPIMSVTP